VALSRPAPPAPRFLDTAPAAAPVRAIDLLRSTAALIGSGWCQGADARDARGRTVEPWQPEARRWSLLGAIVAETEPARLETGLLREVELRRALQALATVVCSESLDEWNDEPGRTQAEVIAALDSAAARLRR
jgi:hypothetical protein